MDFLITLVVALLVVGVLLWAVESAPVIEPTMKQIIKIVVVVAVVLWLLSALLGHGTLIHWPR